MCYAWNEFKTRIFPKLNRIWPLLLQQQYIWLVIVVVPIVAVSTDSEMTTLLHRTSFVIVELVPITGMKRRRTMNIYYCIRAIDRQFIVSIVNLPSIASFLVLIDFRHLAIVLLRRQVEHNHQNRESSNRKVERKSVSVCKWDINDINGYWNVTFSSPAPEFWVLSLPLVVFCFNLLSSMKNEQK